MQSADWTIMVVLISIIGGLVGIGIIMAGIVAVTRIATRHRERMARIGMGLNPDGPERTPNSAPGIAAPSISGESWNRYTTDPTTDAPAAAKPR